MAPKLVLENIGYHVVGCNVPLMKVSELYALFLIILKLIYLFIELLSKQTIAYQ